MRLLLSMSAETIRGGVHGCAADVLKVRPEKTDKADAQALAEMLANGRYSGVHVKAMASALGHQLSD
ncbi:hypothetical protein [Labrys sp. ZIDIC5]|uniref:hypothetical protein n=1 Tax=Labrys sedimenti TaxID=3106036 RepID=UPI002ACC1C2F|nr:hypothetical protein [Labrys sp. ZIDIC5]